LEYNFLANKRPAVFDELFHGHVLGLIEIEDAKGLRDIQRVWADLPKNREFYFARHIEDLLLVDL
jgi:hypothetical protein